VQRASGENGSAGYDFRVVARTWPEPVERVAAFLRETGVEARVEEFEEGTPTAEAAARAVGCELGQIVKSLVFNCDGDPILVLVPGDGRADRAKIAASGGCTKAKIAPPAEVEAATGFAPGSVAPFPLPKIARAFLDRSLLQHRVVWIGAGSPRHMAGLSPVDLARLSRAQSIDAVEERE
jgi:prolyl-tRNA editing enzyme YbaK/EbsC (Cys-tRNA(Pro) deacylase)